jgi:hypothetical protein
VLPEARRSVSDLTDRVCDAALHVGSCALARRADAPFASAEPEGTLELRTKKLDFGRGAFAPAQISQALGFVALRDEICETSSVCIPRLHVQRGPRITAVHRLVRAGEIEGVEWRTGIFDEPREHLDAA